MEKEYPKDFLKRVRTYLGETKAVREQDDEEEMKKKKNGENGKEETNEAKLNELKGVNLDELPDKVKKVAQMLRNQVKSVTKAPKTGKIILFMDKQSQLKAGMLKQLMAAGLEDIAPSQNGITVSFSG